MWTVAVRTPEAFISVLQGHLIFDISFFIEKLCIHFVSQAQRSSGNK